MVVFECELVCVGFGFIYVWSLFVLWWGLMIACVNSVVYSVTRVVCLRGLSSCCFLIWLVVCWVIYYVWFAFDLGLILLVLLIVGRWLFGCLGWCVFGWFWWVWHVVAFRLCGFA